MLKINKLAFNDFLTDIMRYNELVGPIHADESRFEKIKDISKIDMPMHTYFPVKKFFFKKDQVLFIYDISKGKLTVPQLETEKKQRVIVGLKRCDLNSIKRQDMMFLKEAQDPYYAEERERTILIGYHCKEPFDEYCFCSSMDLGDYYDLMLYERDDAYLVEIGSEKGRNFVERYRKYFWDTDQFITPDERRIETDLHLDKKDISHLYNDPGWKELVDKCLSCAACNTLCPSCYCFDIYDKTNADLNSGVRKRNWASCQLQSFTKVAGGHVFRHSREDRYKHRIYHQLQYFKEKHGMNLCTGCGRCIRGCPTRIDFVSKLNEMKEPEYQ